MIVVWKRATKDKREEKKQRKKVRIVFETMLHNSFFLTISKKHTNPKVFPTFALASL